MRERGVRARSAHQLEVYLSLTLTGPLTPHGRFHPLRLPCPKGIAHGTSSRCFPLPFAVPRVGTHIPARADARQARLPPPQRAINLALGRSGREEPRRPGGAARIARRRRPCSIPLSPSPS